MGEALFGTAVPNEAELAGVEEARADALEVAQEEDAPPEARTEDAAAVGLPHLRLAE